MCFCLSVGLHEGFVLLAGLGGKWAEKGVGKKLVVEMRRAIFGITGG